MEEESNIIPGILEFVRFQILLIFVLIGSILISESPETFTNGELFLSCGLCLLFLFLAFKWDDGTKEFIIIYNYIFKIIFKGNEKRSKTYASIVGTLPMLFTMIFLILGIYGKVLVYLLQASYFIIIVGCIISLIFIIYKFDYKKC